MIIFFIILFIFIGLIAGIVQSVKETTTNKRELKRNTETYRPISAARLKHITGLPLPQGSVVDVAYCPDKIVLVKETQNYTISKEKISYIEAVDGKTFQGQAQDAATGMLLLGATGAVLGALTSTSTYMTITFESKGETKCLVLDSNNNTAFVNDVVRMFKTYKNKGENKSTQTIEL